VQLVDQVRAFPHHAVAVVAQQTQLGAEVIDRDMRGKRQNSEHNRSDRKILREK